VIFISFKTFQFFCEHKLICFPPLVLSV